jgi:hypothetical protein
VDAGDTLHPTRSVGLKGVALGSLGQGMDWPATPIGTYSAHPRNPRTPTPLSNKGAPRPNWASLREGTNKVGCSLLIK